VDAALDDEERGLGTRDVRLDEDAKGLLVNYANGDARAALNALELAVAGSGASEDEAVTLGAATVKEAIAGRTVGYDKGGEEHYNLISALHKSLRGSDPQAGLYWLARMIEGGADPLYIARRLVRFAVEDIGMADPQAVHQAMAAWDLYERLGSPEGELGLAQAVIYLGTAPKSNAQYVAFKAAMKSAKETGSLMPPMHILNAPTRLMKDLGYGKGYAYDHDTAEGFSGQNYFPDDMDRHAFYQPVDRGFEREVKKRLDYWDRLRGRGG
jgi:putative ATPase